MTKEDKKKYSEWFNRWYHRDGLGIYYGRADGRSTGDRLSSNHFTSKSPP